MDCYVVVPNVTHHSPKTNIFSPHANPISPNYMLRFQQIEGQAINLHHRCNELPLLMKKRPTSLKIPSAVSFENSVLNSARDRVEEVEVEVEVEEDVYGVYSKKGKSRARLEDRFSAIVNNNVHGHPKEAFFGIYDGHGGPKAAEFAAEKLGDNILNHVRRESDGKLIEEKIRDGYLATDQEFLQGKTSGGACCVTALIQEGNLIVSNLGDCRGVISRGGVAKALTIDHNPSREDEKTRIESKGGYVDCCNGVWRIQSSLAVSRAIGDRHLKQWVIAEPDTKILNIKSDFEFLILASDGLWNKVSNQEAVDVVQPFFTSGSNNKLELKHACRKLVEMSISRGSNDDTSVMVINLGQFSG